MKRIKLIALFLRVSTIAVAQNNFYPTSGSVYLGMPSIGSENGVNLQVHGVHDLCESLGGPKAACPKASRFLMTNTTTGRNSTDGMMFKLVSNSFSMTNQEKGDIRITTNGLHLNFEAQTKRLWLGSVQFSTTPERFAM